MIRLGAAAVFIGGSFLARHERIDSAPVNAAQVSEFTSGLQSELSRLDELYGDHLNEIADEVVGATRRTVSAAVATERRPIQQHPEETDVASRSGAVAIADRDSGKHDQKGQNDGQLN